MKILLVTGGARSGKSRFVEEQARARAGDAVTYVATARVTDPEMEARIEKHQGRRPQAWECLEAPLDAGAALVRAGHATVILDCLTFLVSNAILERGGGADGDEASALSAAATAVDGLLEAAASRDGTLYVVTNEVGSGVVPGTPLGRWFRDAQGWANQRVAAVAARVTLMVCGLPVPVKPDATETGDSVES